MRTDVLEAEPAMHDHASRTEHPDTSTGNRTTHTHTHTNTNARTHARKYARAHTHTQQSQLRTEHPNTKDRQTPTSVCAFPQAFALSWALKQKQGSFGLGPRVPGRLFGLFGRLWSLGAGS